MVTTETLLSVFSGLIGTGVGSGLSYFVMRERQKRQTERRRSEYYFDQQARTLIELYDTLVETHDLLSDHANRDVESYDESKFQSEAKPAVGECKKLIRNAHIYLTQDQYDQIEAVFPAFARTEHYLHWKAEHDAGTPPAEKTMEWKSFDESFTQTRDHLRDVIRTRFSAAEF